MCGDWNLSFWPPGAGGINEVESPFFLAFLDPEGDSPEDTATVGIVYFAHPEMQVGWGVQRDAIRTGRSGQAGGAASPSEQLRWLQLKCHYAFAGASYPPTHPCPGAAQRDQLRDGEPLGRWGHRRAGRGAVCHPGPRGHPAVCQLAADGHLGPGLALAAAHVSVAGGSAAAARPMTVTLSI